MLITIDMPHVFNGQGNPRANARALRIMLDCLIALNESYLATHTVAPLYQAGIVYARTDVWDTIPALYGRKYGDCKSLTAALITELRKRRIACRPVFRAAKNVHACRACQGRGKGCDSCPLLFHILVLTAKGFQDPSKVLGMGSDELAPFYGPNSFAMPE
jgi:hypothetical protein